jgi:hypothetical protein
MTKLSLPDVTLVLIDTDGGELALKALEDTLNLIEPAEVIVLTNQNSVIPSRFPPIPKIKSGEEYGQILWKKIPPLVSTSHILVIQWDGWVINPNSWSSNFLSYDYIGAVWPRHETNRVGNGGFSLRSKKLMDILGQGHLVPGKLEDDNLCRYFRGLLEITDRIHWADEKTANKFSREHDWNFNPREKAPPFPFGFHDVRNWPRVFSPEQLVLRMEMCERNPYISQKQEYQELKEFTKYPPLSIFSWR